MRNILIDCGGYMGQTIDYFKKTKIYNNNQWDIYSIEAIEELCKIIKTNHPEINIINKAVWTTNDILHFYKTKIKKQYLKKYNDFSYIYGQGSSLIKEKNTGNLDKENPLNIEGLNLCKFIRYNFDKGDTIWLKLDIEGAEYEILKHLIVTNTIEYINKLFIEFHYEKVNLDKQVHDSIYNKLKQYKNLEIIEDNPGQKTGDWFGKL